MGWGDLFQLAAPGALPKRLKRRSIMSIRNGLFTSESVSAGHPDKLCDCISDAILDEFLRLDSHARVACETFAANGKIIVAGEFHTRRAEHFEQVRRDAPYIVRRTLRRIGYGTAEHDIDPASCEIEIRFNQQSPQIAAGVNQGEVVGAGDQGMMFGYATDETRELMPLAWSLATDLVARGSSLQRRFLYGRGDSPLKPDAKSQVTVHYVEGRPVGVQTVVLSWQHQPDIEVEELREWLMANVIDPVIPMRLRMDGFRALINPAGPWTIGGPKGDTGLTGRKIIVDTYGGACPHGGGAFSGKDPTKVDRSGAYAARWVAKNIVAAKLARRCTVQLAYAIGVAEPVSISIDTHGTGVVTDEAIERAVRQTFDLTPAGIIRDLDLRRPIYSSTASLGHFGQRRRENIHLWELTDRVEALKAAASGGEGEMAPAESVPNEAEVSVKLEALLTFVQEDDRICPRPGCWNELAEMLPGRERHAQDGGAPPPLILTGWHCSSDPDKSMRLREQIEYAARHGVLDRVDAFLRRLRPEDWYRG
jgi:S-adenosylmethionine synthetase